MLRNESAVMRFAKWFASARVQVWFNGVLMVIWLIAMIPTLVVPVLRTSILYIAEVSIWSLFATHLGAWIAALVNQHAERIDDRTAEHATLAHIEILAGQIANMEVRILARLGEKDAA